MIEYDPAIYGDVHRRLRLLDQTLTEGDRRVNIDLLGVSHAGLPAEMVIARATQADVVTLELTRGVVRAGLGERNSHVLEQNRFWRTLIRRLRPLQPKQLVLGIEINQTPRIAWKNFSLHHDVTTLSASPLTIEVEPDQISQLPNLLAYQGYSSLTPEHLDTLRKRHALTIDDVYATFTATHLTAQALDQPNSRWPLVLCPGVSLVCWNDKEVGERRRGNRLTFITPPDPSLDQTFSGIVGILEKFQVRDKSLAGGLALSAILTYLLAPVELTEAREIALAANQYARHYPKQPEITGVHVGGAHHTAVIESILKVSSPPTPRIAIQAEYDRDYDKKPGMSRLGTFFRNTIPFAHRIRAVNIHGFNATVNPDQILSDVETALSTHQNDFRQSLSKYRKRK